MMRWTSVFAAAFVALPALAADPATVDRTIRKEPAYAGKPKYCLLTFGPEARDRVWLVHDRNTLYVDRNGNGDLTEPGEKVVCENGSPDDGYEFEAGDLKVGGKVHKGLVVTLVPLKTYASNPSLAQIAVLRDAFKADPAMLAARISVDVKSDRFKGAGIGERIAQFADVFDPTGVLTFGSRPADAPVIHFDGPLHITFYAAIPKLRLSRDNDLVLVVGTPGVGGGTFAMLEYEDTIPKGVYPKVEIRWASDPPLRELFELKERC